MAGDLVVMDLFLLVRVILVGGIFFVFPRISRTGLMFGVYVGEEVAGGEPAAALLRMWSRDCLLAMVLALVVGIVISVAGWPVTGDLTGTAVLLLALTAMYLRFYAKARRLAPDEVSSQATVATASLSVTGRSGETFAMVTLAICLLAGLAAIGYTLARYQTLPSRVPTFFSVLGIVRGASRKTLVTALFVPTLNLLVSSFFALLSLLISRAKRSFRGGTGGRSEEAQAHFRAAVSRLYAGTALFLSLILTLLNLQLIRIALGKARSLGIGIGLASGGMILFALAGLILIMTRHGQGGSRAEDGSADAPLTNGLADNSHWVLGVFYVNRKDPAIMVESRFGIGYSMNLGNWHSLLIAGTFLVMLAGLFAIALVAELT